MISGDNGKRDPPVPIPNTEVKPLRADGTWLATARESRSSPDSMRACEVIRRLVSLSERVKGAGFEGVM